MPRPGMSDGRVFTNYSSNCELNMNVQNTLLCWLEAIMRHFSIAPQGGPVSSGSFRFSKYLNKIALIDTIFIKTSKILLLTQSCDNNGLPFAQAKIHNLKQSRRETKSKTHNLKRKTYPGPSIRLKFAHWALRDAKLTKMSIFGNFKTSCPVTPYYS